MGGLLSCPFCGAPAMVIDEPRTTKVQIMCGKDCECMPGTDWHEPEQARAVWNTRMTLSQDSVSDVERLRAVVSTTLFRSDLVGTSAQIDQATNEIVAALAVPINKIGEDGK